MMSFSQSNVQMSKERFLSRRTMVLKRMDGGDGVKTTPFCEHVRYKMLPLPSPPGKNPLHAIVPHPQIQPSDTEKVWCLGLSGG